MIDDIKDLILEFRGEAEFLIDDIKDLILEFRGEAEFLIGVVAGVKYYENPIRGDEAPLMIKVGGRLVSTDYWELSDVDEDA